MTAPLSIRRHLTFQSTLPHGSDQYGDTTLLPDYISIHAPSRERLNTLLRMDRQSNFNPRSLTGATSWVWPSASFASYFNPRSLTGATIRTRSVVLITVISIHAPSRERHYADKNRCRECEFQSTLPHGSDYCFGGHDLVWRNFNPRSLTGATFLLSTRCPCPRHFNPRSLTGATMRVERAQNICQISIHAPSRERRCSNRLLASKMRISIHAPSRERLAFQRASKNIVAFQSTLPHGSDCVLSSLAAPAAVFQSTLPHGSDV